MSEWLQVNSTFEERIFGGPKQVSGTFGIYSELCFPVSSGSTDDSIVQFLIHGGGFDHLYWDNAPGYSYVDYAAEQGYSTFNYDRLGTGLSDHPDPIQVTQTPLHIAIAHELIQLLRNGGLADRAFKQIAGVGHSYGTAQILGITIVAPKDFDAIVLTGTSADQSGMLANHVGQVQTIAALNEPLRFSNLSYGYALPGAIEGLQYAFFRAPAFDPQLLNLAESIKQPQGPGEVIGGFEIKPSEKFTGPLYVINGENDLRVCFGDCLKPSNKVAAVKDLLFPSASNGSDWYLVPGTGHGINFHYTANDAYEHIQAFLKANGF